MNCYYHSDAQSVANCTDCGKPLCKKCASNFEQPLCKSCVSKRNSNLKSIALKNLAALIGALVIGILLTVWMVAENGTENFIGQLLADIIIGLAIAGVPSGWKALDKITPNIFLILPIVGWLIYFFVKGVLSMIVGVFILPVKTVKGIIQYVKSKKLDSYISENY